MSKRDSHLGSSHDDKISYMKKIKSTGDEAKTLPEKDFDATSASTAAELDIKIKKLETRYRAVHNKIFNKKILTSKNILIVFIIFLLTQIINLNKDLGKVEERVKDIPVFSEKLDLIYEKLGKINMDIKTIKIIIEKNDELHKNKFDNLDKKINSINRKIEK